MKKHFFLKKFYTISFNLKQYINPSNIITLSLFLFGAIIQLWPAVFNGYVLLAPDSFYYIECGMMHYVPIHRPVHYGVFIKLFSFGNSLWSVIIFQAVILSYLIYRFVPEHLRRSWYLMGGIYLLLGLTGSPWYVSQAMPDIFGAYVLLCLLIIIQKKYVNYIELLLICILCGFSITTHKINMIIVPLVLLVNDFLSCSIHILRGKSFVVEKIKLLPYGLVVFAWLFYAFINYTQDGKFDYRPHSSHAFILSRLSENGLLERYLKDHCESENYKLCQYKDSLPRNTQSFLFDQNSPFIKTDGWNNAYEHKRIIKDIFLSPKYFGINVKMAVRASRLQLTRFRIGHLLWKHITDGSWGPPILERFFPNEYDNFQDDKQMNEGIDFITFSTINNYLILFFVCLMSLLIILSLIQKRNQDYYMISFLILFIILNASVPASLVGITPRYHGRLIWIIILVAIDLLYWYSQPLFSKKKQVS